MLAIVGTTLLVGLIAGFLAGGRIGRLSEVHFVGTPLAFGALAVMVVVPLADLGDRTDRFLIAAGYGLAAAFLVVNIVRRRGAAFRVGLAVLALGWLLNATVMVANGGMPLSRAAYAASGQSDAPTPGHGGFFKIVIADEGTHLRALGDVITVHPFRRVVSAGDLVLMAGLAVTIVAGMRGPRLRRSLGSESTPSKASSALQAV
jgi:hypothetical protein